MTRCTIALLLAASLLLAGCGADDDGLKQFTARVKARPAGSIQPIPEIVPYKPFTYLSNGRRSPFLPSLHNAKSQPRNHGLAPNLKRPRDPLEKFPLDALHMVGTISTNGTAYALIQAPDKVIYRVARGDHMGQQFGKIESVSKAGVTLIEIVPDGTGGYVKRATALAPSG